jgi:hypothetical protein
MEFSFTRYLLSKQSVDDRSLNRQVYETMVANLPPQPIRIIEIGAGIGTMLMRLLRWNILQKAEYILVDEMAENIEYAPGWIQNQITESGLSAERVAPNQLRVFDQTRDIRITFERADIFDFIQKNPAPADILIAHAVLDLLPMPDSLPKLFSLTKNLAWFTINFDGVTSLEPVINPLLDRDLERLYHATMDSRPSGGDSQTGRHLAGHLKNSGAKILAMGASDWVVYATDGKYPADEKYFLQCILHFFEETLSNHPELDAKQFSNWLAKRQAQIESGELAYIAHQMDYLAKVL